MSDFRFLHAADLHLDSPLRGLDSEAPAELLRGASRHALVNLINTAIEERVAFVLLAGDLYDSRLYDWHTGQFLIQQLGRLLREGIEVVAIAGNHDPLNQLARGLKVPGMMGADRPHTRRLNAAPVAVHGQSYGVAEVKDDLSRAYPQPIDGLFNIGMLHTACGLGGHENYAPCRPEDLARVGYDYWALGHVHTRVVLSQNPWMVFPGNLQGRHIKETGAKGATLVSVERGRVVDATHVPLDVLRWVLLDVDATDAADEDDVLGRIRFQIDNAALLSDGRFLAVRIRLVGECAAHAGLMRSPEATLQAVRAASAEIAGPEGLFIEEVRIATQPPVDRSLQREQPGAVGALITALEAPVAVDESMAAFIKDQLRRADGALEPDHPAWAIEKGSIPEALLARARALVLAELAQR
jgi:DNA repair exonuclease SbcCD nuclease subunit